MSDDTRAAALEILRTLVGRADADFHEGQFEAIEALVDDRSRALVVQRTGWGKSAVYFVATLLLRRRGAGPTVLVSPLLALMRDQIAAAERAGVRAVAINSTNAHEWGDVLAAARAPTRSTCCSSRPERLNNPRVPRRAAARARRSGWACWSSTRRTASATGATTSAPTTGASATCIAAMPRGRAGARDDRDGQQPRRHRRRRAARQPAAHARSSRSADRWPAPRCASGVLRLPDARGAARLAAQPPRRPARLAASSTRSPSRPPQDTARLLREARPRRARLHRADRPRRARGVRGGCSRTTGSRRWSPRARSAWASTSPTSASSSTSARRRRRWRTTSRSGAPGARPSSADVLLLPGPEDRDIWQLLRDGVDARRRSGPSAVLAELAATARRCRRPRSRPCVDIRRTPLELLLKVLDVDGAVQRVQGGWVVDRPAVDLRRRALRAHRRGPRRRAAAHARVRDARAAAAWSSCSAPSTTTTAAPCGRCDNCAGAWYPDRASPTARRHRPSAASSRVGVADRAARAVADRRRPARRPGARATSPADERADEGRALARLTDLGLGRRAARRSSRPAPPTRPSPRRCSRGLRPGARRLGVGRAAGGGRRDAVAAPPAAGRLARARASPRSGRLPFLGTLDLATAGPSGEPGGNSAFRLAGVWDRSTRRRSRRSRPGPGAAGRRPRRQPWTLTVAARELRRAGARPCCRSPSRCARRCRRPSENCANVGRFARILRRKRDSPTLRPGDRRGVDHEAVADVAAHDAVVCPVDLVGADRLDHRGDAVLGAEVEHLLRLADAADVRAGDRAARAGEREHAEALRVLGQADEHERAVQPQQSRGTRSTGCRPRPC